MCLPGGSTSRPSDPGPGACPDGLAAILAPTLTAQRVAGFHVHGENRSFVDFRPYVSEQSVKSAKSRRVL